MMKCYDIIECDYLSKIQSELLAIINKIDTAEGWNFLNKLDLKHAPSVIKFCKELKLVVQDFSITVLRDNLNLHIDAMHRLLRLTYLSLIHRAGVMFGTVLQMNNCNPVRE